MVIGTTRHCHFCGQEHFVGDAWGPEWCEKNSQSFPEETPTKSQDNPYDGFSNLEGKPVPPPVVGIHELFGLKRSKK